MSARLEKALREVDQAVRKLPRVRKPEKWAGKNYVGGGQSRLEYLDLTAPVLRARFRDGFSFSNLPIAEQWKIWDYIWRTSKTFEVMNGAIEFAAIRPIEELFKRRKTLLTWVKNSDNWAHSDSLSSIYARLLEHERPALLPQLERWVRHRDPWARRQSLVSLLYYSSARVRDRVLPFRVLIGFVERHLDDSHYYVQKGVGWTIRETFNLYPKETVKWLEKKIDRVAAPAWQAATEKLSPAIKAGLKAKRKRSPRGKSKSAR